MVRRNCLHWLMGIVAMLACATARADDSPGQEMLDKAMETKLTAETAGDLNDVITFCRDALEAGLNEPNTQFANELLASTLTQRADLICTELFERPVRPARGRRLLQMAVTDLQETLRINSEQPLAQHLIGRIYAHLGQKKQALEALNTAIRLAGEDRHIQARSLIVRANLREEPAEQLADFDEAVELTPGDPDVFRYRGMYHLSENRVDNALADFHAALEIEPDDTDTLEAAGLAQSVLEKYDEAMESFNKVIELEPKSPSAYTHRARVRAIQGDMDAALADVEEALKMQPGSVQALRLHASLLGGNGEFEKALRDLNMLRTAMPDDPELLLQIGAMYQASKQPDEAIRTYGTLLDADAKNVAAYRGRADSYLSLGKQAEAIADYEKAIENEPNDSGSLNNLAWVLATSPDDELRDGKRAIELAKQACEVTEYKEAHIISTLAASYAEVGDFESAIDWSKKAVELGPDALKGQLQKERDSYKEHKPWREAIPPDLAAAPQDRVSANEPSPPTDETARTKARR